MNIIPITSGILVIVSLALAWLLVFTRALEVPVFRRIFVQDQDLLRAHIDYLLMAILLVVFHLSLTVIPIWMQVCMCAGATLNPFIFLLVAVWPTLRKSKPTWFTLLTTGGFVLTTLGFGGAAVLLIRANL